MAVSDAELAAVKLYMKIDHTEEDSLIKALYAAAVLYLKGGGLVSPEEDPDLYNLAVWGLTLHYYEHRDAVGNEASIPTVLRPIINQQKMDGVVEHAIKNYRPEQ